MTDKPAFEITDLSGKAFQIFADGRLVGLDGDGACIVINRIPQLLAEARAEGAADRYLAPDTDPA